MPVLATCLALVGSACDRIGSNRAAVSPPKATGLTIQVYFDGGYLFDLSRSDAFDVYSLNEANYPMLMQVGASDGSPQLKLAGSTVTLRLDTKDPTPLKPGIPPYDRKQTGCTSGDSLARNNLLFIPNLAEAATGMGTKVKAVASVTRYAGLHLTGGGELSVIALGGCVEYRDPGNNPVGAKRSMASGIQGLMYEWRDTGASTLTIVQTDAGGKETPTEATPNANGLVVLYVSSFMKGIKNDEPHRIDHFKDHFDGVFDTIDEKKRISLWWLGSYLVSPGIDCPPGSIVP
jgi:hypothetical protein